MKIITYNVNGLRARISPHGSLHGFLTSLDGDILCFQETKLSKQELTSDIAMAEGYEAFFSCTRTSNKGRIGYAGVATFCRTQKTTRSTSAVLPIAADEGFSGVLHCSRSGIVEGGDSRVGCYDEVLNIDTISREELFRLDSEGRCVVTDHASFVLFNIYGPCVQLGDTKRMQFKLNFFRALQCRWESLLKQGRRIMVVGDLNIAPFPIDSCDPGPEFNANPCRKWFRSMLDTEGGPFTDVFRAFHCEKRDAYTCWSQASGAEEFNWGTRIDLILAAGPCLHLRESAVANRATDNCHGFAKCEAKDCNIMTKFKRFKEDSIPRWAGGRSLKLEGSDHAPVFVLLQEQPLVQPHGIPSLAVRFLPQLRGRQQSIYSLLQKRSVAGYESEPGKKLCTGVSPETEFSCVDNMHNNMKESTTESVSRKEHETVYQCNIVGNSQKEPGGVHNLISQTNDSANSSQGEKFTCASSMPTNQGCSGRSAANLKPQSSQKFRRKAVLKACQTSLRSFFVPNSGKGSLASDVYMSQPSDSGTLSPSSEESNTKLELEADIARTSNSPFHMDLGLEVGDDDARCIISIDTVNMQQCSTNFAASQESMAVIRNPLSADMSNKHNEKIMESSFSVSEKVLSNLQAEKAQMEWKRIQELMARRIPVCEGHGEPCAARIVKKAGPNVGRGFYVCARAQGPASNPEARCDHFEWASEKGRK